MEQAEELEELLKKYPKLTACILYQTATRTDRWFISAAPTDNEETLRKHLEAWRPEGEFIGWAIKK